MKGRNRRSKEENETQEYRGRRCGIIRNMQNIRKGYVCAGCFRGGRIWEGGVWGKTGAVRICRFPVCRERVEAMGEQKAAYAGKMRGLAIGKSPAFFGYIFCVLCKKS